MKIEGIATSFIIVEITGRTPDYKRI